MIKFKITTSAFILTTFLAGNAMAMHVENETCGPPATRKKKCIEMNEVKQVAEGVYAGQGKTASGENIYFGLELIDTSNEKKWERYKNHVSMDMLENTGGLMIGLVNLLTQDRNIHNPTVLGFDDQEFVKYTELLSKNGFLGTEAKNIEKQKALNVIRSGVTACVMPDKGEYYIAYISTKPVMGRFPFKEQPKTVNIKQFDELYRDIVMCVGVHKTQKGQLNIAIGEGQYLDLGEESYTNRGIFRNPTSMINNDYKAISLPLHGFTAAVASQDFDEKNFMSVAPIRAMHEILCKSLEPGQMYINYSEGMYRDGIKESANLERVYINPKTKLPFAPIPKDLKIIGDPEQEKAYLADFQAKAAKLPVAKTYGEVHHLVKIEALASLYK